VQLSSIAELEAVSSVTTREVSGFEKHLIDGTPIVRTYTWFGGKLSLTLTTVSAQTVDQAIRAAERDCLSSISLRTTIDTYLAIAAVKSMLMNDLALHIPTANWLVSEPYRQLSCVLSNEQLQLIVDTHRVFQSWLDGQRQPLSVLA